MLTKPARFHYEKRAETRTPLLGCKIQYSFPFLESDRPFREGIAVNISNFGTSFITTQKLVEGIEVRLQSKALGSSARDAVVMWCRHLNDSTYRVGVFLH